MADDSSTQKYELFKGSILRDSILNYMRERTEIGDIASKIDDKQIFEKFVTITDERCGDIGKSIDKFSLIQKEYKAKI